MGKSGAVMAPRYNKGNPIENASSRKANYLEVANIIFLVTVCSSVSIV